MLILSLFIYSPQCWPRAALLYFTLICIWRGVAWDSSVVIGYSGLEVDAIIAIHDSLRKWSWLHYLGQEVSVLMTNSSVDTRCACGFNEKNWLVGWTRFQNGSSLAVVIKFKN